MKLTAYMQVSLQTALKGLSPRLLALGDVSGSGLDPQYHHLMHKVQLVSTAARPQTFCL